MSTLSLLYWFLVLVALLFSGWGYWGADPTHRHWYGGVSLVWCALVVIGIKVFPLALT